MVAEFDRALHTWLLLGPGRKNAARVRYVARLLRERGVWQRLERAWAIEDERGDASAAVRMGWVLLDRGDRPGSERAFDRAAQRGHLEAMWRRLNDLARAGRDIAALREDYQRAKRRQRQDDELADQRGDADAAYRIGQRLIAEWRAIESKSDQARKPELGQAAEAALLRAAERNSADAAVELGDLASEDHPDSAESDAERGERALPWYRRADELGHPRGSWRLGRILRLLGDDEGAYAAFQRAADRGEPLAVSSLATQLRDRKPLDRSALEAAYRRVTEIDYDSDGWLKLGGLLEWRGDLDGAEAAYRRAVERRVGGADFALRRLRERRADNPPASGR